MKIHRLLPVVMPCALLALAGCAIGPDYRRPALELPASYKELGDWRLADPADSRPRGPWWEVYGDPVLNSLQGRVELSSNTLQVAEAQYRQAQAAATIAGASLWPALNATGSAGRSRTASRTGGDGTTGDAFAAGLAASWEFDLWGRVRRSAEAGRAAAAASAADLESVRLAVHATLAQTYFTLRIADEQSRLYARLVQGYERFLEITQNRLAQGIGTKADLSAASAQLKTAQAQAVDLSLQRRQLEHALAVLLGQPPASFSLPPEELRLQPPEIPALLPSQLLERRPDIAAAERRLAAASAQVGVAKGGYFPVFSLSAAGGFQGSQTSHLFSAPNEVWSLGAAAVLPLFNAGRTGAQVAQARAVFEAGTASYRQAVLVALQEVEDQLAANQLLAIEAKVQGEAVAAARQSATIALNQYKAGTVSYLNVVTAMSTQLNAERAAVDLLGRRLNASVALLRALGGGWSCSP